MAHMAASSDCLSFRIIHLSSSFDGQTEDGTMDMHDDATSNGYTPSMRANGGDSSARDAKSLSRQIPMWLSDSTPDEFVVCCYTYSIITLLTLDLFIL